MLTANQKDGEILVAELQDWMQSNKKFNLIEIGEEYERDDYKLNDTYFIPMGEIMNSLGSLNKVIYCQTCKKSKAVVSMMKRQNFAEVYNLVGGIHEWVTQEFNSY